MLPVVPLLVALGALAGAAVLASRRPVSDQQARDTERIHRDLERWRDRVNAVDAAVLGEAVVFDLGDAARAVVERALVDATGVAPIAPDRWLVDWGRGSDLGIGWSEQRGGGGALSVWWARETFGVLVGALRWRSILRSVERSCAAAGVLPHRRAGRLVDSGVEVDGDRLWLAG